MSQTKCIYKIQGLFSLLFCCNVSRLKSLLLCFSLAGRYSEKYSHFQESRNALLIFRRIKMNGFKISSKDQFLDDIVKCSEDKLKDTLDNKKKSILLLQEE